MHRGGERREPKGEKKGRHRGTQKRRWALPLGKEEKADKGRTGLEKVAEENGK